MEESKTHLYGKLTTEKLRKIIEEAFKGSAGQRLNDMQDWLNKQSPEAQEAFHEALKEQANNWTIKENLMDTGVQYDSKIEKAKKAYEENERKFEQSSTGKVRKKNTHLTPKKKKRKR